MSYESEAYEAALHGLSTARSLAERAGALEEQGHSNEAAAMFLDAYGHVSAAHVLLDLGAGGDDEDAQEAFDVADALRTQLHEELLERLGVPFVSAEEIGKIQERRRQRWRLRVIPGGKETNARKRRLMR